MNEEIATHFRTEGTPAFPVEKTETDDSAASSTGETSTEQTPAAPGEQTGTDTKPDEGDKAGGEAGFADHPRWKEREEDWTKRFNEQETRHTDELTKVTTSIEAKVAEALKAAGVGAAPADANATPEQVPAWFGGDEAQWADFRKWNNSELAAAEARGADKAMKGIEEKSQAEQKAIDDATAYMNDEVAGIEADKTLNPKGEKVDRNKLLKFVLDNDLVDSKGRWNYKAAYRMMQGQPAQAAAASTEDRKKLAADTTSENRAEPRPEPYTSSTDFSKPGARPW